MYFKVVRAKFFGRGRVSSLKIDGKIALSTLSYTCGDKTMVSTFADISFN